MKLDNLQMIEIYKVHFGLAEFYDAQLFKRLTLFLALIPTIFAGVVAGVLNANEWYHFLILVGGPACMIGLARTAYSSAYRMYQIWLDHLTVTAKIEKYFELDQRLEHDEKSYWKGESFLATRWVDARNSFQTSANFTKNRLLKGDMVWIGKITKWSEVFSFALAAFLIFMTIVTLLGIVTM